MVIHFSHYSKPKWIIFRSNGYRFLIRIFQIQISSEIMVLRGKIDCRAHTLFSLLFSLVWAKKQKNKPLLPGACMYFLHVLFDELINHRKLDCLAVKCKECKRQHKKLLEYAENSVDKADDSGNKQNTEVAAENAE